MTEESAQLDSLLDLFEKHSDVPAEAVKIAHGVRVPGRVVRNDDHHSPLAVFSYSSFYSAQFHFDCGLASAVTSPVHAVVD